VWDGFAGATRVAPCKTNLHQQRDWLTIERLPGYAPDLNPVETLWGNIKGQELANRCADKPGGTGRGGPQWHGANQGFWQVAVFPF